MKAIKILLVVITAGLSSQLAQAQYFGQNKPRYHKLDFEVLKTPHFEIHHYLKDKAQLQEFATDAEHWYLLHKAVLQDSFGVHNPLLLYNDHADFQMTNAINSQVGVGTGGVTEGLKNRLIMPFAFTMIRSR